jgi:hypothetical protein
MFIYKITNLDNNLCYIGLDTHEEYKQKRWKDHKRDCQKIESKFYKAFRDNVDKFSYEILYRTTEIGDLMMKEIEYISYFDSYKNGYNNSPGGDAFNHRSTKNITPKIYEQIILARREWTTELNNRKWEDTTPCERKFLCKHLHTDKIYKMKSDSLKEYYKAHPEAIEEKRIKMKITRNENKEVRDEQARLAGLLGAAKVSKKVKVEFHDGSTKMYDSKASFNKEHGYLINRILLKTKENMSHKGFKAWEM